MSPPPSSSLPGSRSPSLGSSASNPARPARAHTRTSPAPPSLPKLSPPLACRFAHSSSRIDACMNDAEPRASRRVISTVFSVSSLFQAVWENSQISPHDRDRAKLNPPRLRLSKMESPLTPSVARSSAWLLQYLRTIQLGPETQPLHSAHCNRVSTFNVRRHFNVVLVLPGPAS